MFSCAQKHVRFRESSGAKEEGETDHDIGAGDDVALVRSAYMSPARRIDVDFCSRKEDGPIELAVSVL